MLKLLVAIYLIAYAMEKSPWEANWISASQEIYLILSNPYVHYSA
jgi:hypothetical protein